MAYKFVIVFALVSFSYCVCHPVKTSDSRDGSASAVSGEAPEVVVPMEAQTQRTESNLVDVLNSVYAYSIQDHVIVKRSKRGGIIHGGNCPEGEGNLPSGECVPCLGRNLPGCPKVEENDDYYNDV